MSSWDSYNKIDRHIRINNVKLKGKEIHVPLYSRVVYDTPNFVSYELVFNVKDLFDMGVFKGIWKEDRYIPTGKGWSKESRNIDARDMSDSDVHDLFVDKIYKQVVNFETKGITWTQLKNFITDDGIEFK